MKLEKLLQAAIITFVLSVFTGINWSYRSHIVDSRSLQNQIVLTEKQLQK
jgi:hypothetical protein